MANTKFQIVIAAVDRATAVVGKVNASFAKLTRPIVQAQAAVGRFNKEMGFDRVARGMVDVGKAAVDVGRNVSAIVAPMAAIAGVGSIAAVAELATQWGRLGAEVGRSAVGIGDTTDQLQGLRGAAQLSGVSSEALTSGLKSLGDTMQDALYGRNQQALVMMNRLGLRMKTTTGGAVDTTAAFTDLAGAISRIQNPQVQNLVARTFGLEAALPLLRRGKEGLAELLRQMQATGAIMTGPQIAAAAAFDRSLTGLSLSVEGLRNSIGDRLIPIVQPLVDKLTVWISANRDLIATKVGDFVSGFAQAVEQIDWSAVIAGVKSFAAGVEALVDRLGGWKTVAIATAVVMNGSLIASVLNLTSALVRLGVGTIPVVIRGVALLGVAAQSLFAGSALRVGLLTARLGGLAAVIPGATAIVEGLSGAFVAVGAAIEAAPVSWIVTGIAAIGVAGYGLYKHWSDIGAWWHRLWGDIGKDVARGSEKVKSAGAVLSGAQVSGGRGAPMLEAAARRTAARKEAAVANAVRDPIGLRQNNPGNLRAWGAAPVANGYVQFGSAADGLSALVGNLQAYGKHGWNTLESISSHWAPTKDGNNVAAYIANLKSQTGFNPTAALDLSDPKVLAALVPAIVRNENGKNPYDAGMIAQAISSRLGKPVPVATDVTADPVPTPYQMPQGAGAGAAPAASGSGGILGTIVVEFQNMPAGARVQSKPGGQVQIETRVGYAMAGNL